MRGSSSYISLEGCRKEQETSAQRFLLHIGTLCRELKVAAECCKDRGCGWTSLLLVMSSSELLSLYWAGSRRTAGRRGSKALYGFLVSYFPRFNSSAKGPDGNYYRVRIPLLREGGKASKRLKLPSALVHIYRRGAMEGLVAEEEEPTGKCVILGKGRWGFVVNPWEFVEDFKETLDRFLQEIRCDAARMQRCLQRFNHLYG